MKPTNEWKVNKTKFPKLRDEHIQVYQDGINFSIVHVSSGITVDADTRDTPLKNWELAQEALNSALEHQEAI